jgi:transcriptional regulator with GAF, ATPase, and Fis domain
LHVRDTQQKMTGRDEATSADASDELRPSLAVVVRVLDDGAHPREYALTSGVCRIGAGRDADIIIQDASVSRLHAELSLAPEGVVVHDLGSRNGTYYLGQRLERMVLSLGSRIQLGRATVALEPNRERLAQNLSTAFTSYGELVGTSPPMRRLFGLLHRLEGSLVSVLVQGESGTGKELVARALHAFSLVQSGPFVAVNCGALDRTLARSELFGHKRGAFTGASEAHVGAFEAASGGTLFLDEVGELPLEVQPLLLRALELSVITRVGENTERPVKVRVVAATNRDLAKEVEAGRFRQDLWYRLRVVGLDVPPLRDPDDIEILARSLAGREGIDLTPEVLRELRARPWPGNGRELRNALRAYSAIGTLGDLPGTPERDRLDAAFQSFIDLDRPYAEQKEVILTRFLRVYLKSLLDRTGGNQSEAARISGLTRSYLNKVLGQGSGEP